MAIQTIIKTWLLLPPIHPIHGDASIQYEVFIWFIFLQGHYYPRKHFLIQQIVFRDLISTTFHITWRIITSGILTSFLCYSFARIVPLLRSITCLSQGFVLFRLFSAEKPDEIHSDIFSVKNRTTSIPTSCELVLINLVIGFYIYVRISQHLFLWHLY